MPDVGLQKQVEQEARETEAAACRRNLSGSPVGRQLRQHKVRLSGANSASRNRQGQVDQTKSATAAKVYRAPP